MYFGSIREIVYPVGHSTDNAYLSELIWDISSVPFLGLAGEITTENNLKFRLDFQGAIPVVSGQMHDYDWMYLSFDGSSFDPGEDNWSHRSISDNHLDYAFIIEAEISGPLLSGRRWGLHIAAGYHLDWWSFSGTKISSLYTEQGGLFFPVSPKDYEDGDPFRNAPGVGTGTTSITYEVAFHIPFAGLMGVYQGDRFRFSTRLAIGPVIAADHDHHIYTGYHYFDTGIGGPWMQASIYLGFRLGEAGELFLDSQFSGFPEFSGTVQQYTESGSYVGGTTGGAGFQYWNTSFSLGYAFRF